MILGDARKNLDSRVESAVWFKWEGRDVRWGDPGVSSLFSQGRTAVDVDSMITGILVREGAKYTNNPHDSGGPTKYGITQATLSSWRGHPVTASDVEHLQEEEARQIYRAKYYVRPGFEQVANLSPAIAEELVDTGVNSGPVRATLMLQRALNGLNKQGQAWPDLVEDGDLGPGTLRALHAFLAQRGRQGETVMLRYLNGLQLGFYDDLARRRQKDEDFMYGWILNRVVV